MQYIFNNKEYFIESKKYLEKRGIDHFVYDIRDYYIINVFDVLEKEKIEKEQPTFLETTNLDLEHGYLVTKKYKQKTIVDVCGTKIGGGDTVIIAGPCSVEKEDTVFDIASRLKQIGVNILRGGAFKPRTSPYEFQGFGKKGIDILYNIKKALNIPIVTEILDTRDLDYMIDKVDILQVGARNMYNYPLLRELGKTKKPILLKRGLSATLKEFLLSAEYILLEGNENVILCERGIRTYETYTRNTFDIASLALIKELSHLPVLADPSHSTGKRSLVEPIIRASISIDVDGIIVETHSNPDLSWSDSKQTISIDHLEKIIKNIG